MINSDATDRFFINEIFAQKHDLVFHLLEFSRYVFVVNERRIFSGVITHTVKASVTIETHIEILKMFVTKLRRYFIILEIS